MKLREVVALSCVVCMTSQLTSSMPTEVNNKENDIIISAVSQQRLQAKLLKSQETKLQQRNSRPAGCPSNFAYYPSVNGCYKVVTSLLDWDAAGLRCHSLDSKAHLLIINNAREQSSIVADKLRWFSGCAHFWTAGQRINLNWTHSPFAWKVMSYSEYPTAAVTEMSYTNWQPGQPSNSGPGEPCMHVIRDWNYAWNDNSCSAQICSVCEIDM